MKKIELKNLLPYLPYGLKAQDELGEILDIEMFEHNKKYRVPETIDGLYKPILCPLSYLIKEEVQGFSVGVRLQLRHLINDEKELFDIEVLLSRISYYELEWLFERHFDVFGLIEKGLAVDINTLKI